ncbi:MAG: hypothetical protein JNL68_17275 [Burkholderiales bacterium]|nr:hypothetical protein [Burkholderiales bacterium]
MSKSSSAKETLEWPLLVLAVIILVAIGLPTDWSLHDWYLDNCAQIHVEGVREWLEDSSSGDIVSTFFVTIAMRIAEFAIPAWNWLFAHDSIRFILPFVVAGFAAKLGHDLYESLKRNARRDGGDEQ